MFVSVALCSVSRVFSPLSSRACACFFYSVPISVSKSRIYAPHIRCVLTRVYSAFGPPSSSTLSRLSLSLARRHSSLSLASLLSLGSLAAPASRAALPRFVPRRCQPCRAAGALPPAAASACVLWAVSPVALRLWGWGEGEGRTKERGSIRSRRAEDTDRGVW